MSRQRVLRIPRSDDEEGSFVLLQVEPSSSSSSSSSKKTSPLDVKIVATEGTTPYVVTLKHSGIGSLRTSGSTCSSEEWEHILECVLLGRQHLEDIHLTATVRSGLEITVRKKVQRITQRLGVISLQENETEEVELFDWCGLAVQAFDKTRSELASASARIEGLEQAVGELRGQLEELVRAKAEHELALLDKFRRLLNEKKAKIREQHEIIKSGRFDSVTSASPRVIDHRTQVKVEEQQEGATTASCTTARPPVASRKPKRKAPAPEPRSDSGDGLDVMDIDGATQGADMNGDSSDDHLYHTDDGDDDATASEPDPDITSARIETGNEGATKGISKGKGRSGSPPRITSATTKRENKTAAAAAAAAATTTPPPPPPQKTVAARTRQRMAMDPSVAQETLEVAPTANVAGTASKQQDGSETESDDEL